MRSRGKEKSIAQAAEDRRLAEGGEAGMMEPELAELSGRKTKTRKLYRRHKHDKWDDERWE